MRRPIVWCGLPLGLGLLTAYPFRSLGDTLLEGFRLDLGSRVMAAEREAYYLMYWTRASAVAAPLIALGLARVAALPRVHVRPGPPPNERSDRVDRRRHRARDRHTVHHPDVPARRRSRPSSTTT